MTFASLPSSITSAAFTLRTQYMKYLYPYECEKESLSSLAELQSAIDGNKRETRRPIDEYPSSPFQSFAPFPAIPHMFTHRFGFDPMRGQGLQPGGSFLRPTTFASPPFYSPLPASLTSSSNALAALEVMRSKTEYVVKKKVLRITYYSATFLKDLLATNRVPF